MIRISKARNPRRAIRVVLVAIVVTLATGRSWAADEGARTGALPAADPASVGFAPDRVAFLNTTMHQIVDKGEVAGVVTLLARHGKVVSVDSYGKNNVADATPLRRDAIFRIYSQTKPITGVA